MGQGVLKLWCYALFDRFQRYVEIVRKSDEKSAITLSLGNVMTSKAHVRCKSIEATLLYQIYVFYC